MAHRVGLRSCVLSALECNYTLKKNDLGSDARLSKKGMTFETESWEIQCIGHLCSMQMKAFLGLMRMETIIIAPIHVDAPLINLDWVKAFGNETQIAELYDTQLQPLPKECEEAFDLVCERYKSLPDTPRGDAHWYDDILYPCSLHKKGRGLTESLSLAASEYLKVYTEILTVLPGCDEQKKKAIGHAFAERLFEEGGPAVDQVTKLFGKETAKRLILQHMYGVR